MAQAQEVCRRGLAAIGGKPLAPLSFCWVPHREAWPLPSLRDALGAFWAEGFLPGTVKSLATLTVIARWHASSPREPESAALMSLMQLRQEIEHRRDDDVDRYELDALKPMECPSPHTIVPMNTPMKSEPTSARPNESSSGCGAIR